MRAGSVIPSEAAGRAPGDLFRSLWIVGPRYDLLFFSFSVLLSLGFYALYQISTTPINANSNEFFFALAFYGIFDHPHILQTFSRCFKDDTIAASKRRRYFGLWLGLLALGFVLRWRNLWAPFCDFLSLFGVWHIYRQNHGMLAIYQRRDSACSPQLRRCERSLLGTCVLYSLVSYLTYTDYAPWLAPWVKTSVEAIFILHLAIWLVMVIWSWSPTILPRLQFLVVIMGFTVWAYTQCIVPLVIHIAIETIYHDVQYQAWMRRYQLQRYAHDRTIAVRWLGYSMLYGALFTGLVLLLRNYPQWLWLTTPFVMTVCFHYYVDGKIWRRFRLGP